MDEMNLRAIIAENLGYYRRKTGLTQAALAEKLNYSDKSVSKWERGDGLPDVMVLYRLAEYYGITLNDLVTPVREQPAQDEIEEVKAAQEPIKKSRFSLRTRILVPTLSIGLVWLATMVVLFFLKVIYPAFSEEGLVFLYGIPASFIVATVFAAIWWNRLSRIICVSGIIWSVALCVFATIRVPYIGLIFAVAGILQILACLLFIQMKK